MRYNLYIVLYIGIQLIHSIPVWGDEMVYITNPPRSGGGVPADYNPKSMVEQCDDMFSGKIARPTLLDFQRAYCAPTVVTRTYNNGNTRYRTQTLEWGK